MNESRETAADQPGARPSTGRAPVLRGPRFRVGAVVALAALAGLVAWLVVDPGGGSSSKPSNPGKPVALSSQGLRAVAGALRQPIYWVGEQSNSSYELTQAPGRLYIRYLPKGVKAGDAKPLLTIGTYPLTDAFNVMRKSPQAAGTTVLRIPGGGIAILKSGNPKSVYAAYPASNYQIEVYSPKAATARELALSGRLQPVLTGTTSRGIGPVVASPGRLRSFATSLGHPLYWAGARTNVTYELTRTTDGRTYIRYLPKGVAVGSKGLFLTIGTYPLANAFAVTQGAAKGPGTRTIHLPGGGIAVYSTQHPTNVHLAFPGSDLQLEVYDPSPSVPPRLVASGKVVAVG